MADIYTLDGVRIDAGKKESPEIIGPDDNVAYTPRTVTELAGTPSVLVDAEVRDLLPIARLLADFIGITCMQEVQYGNVQQQIRERAVFVVLNVIRHKIEDGVANYAGLVIMCKKHPIVRVICKCHIATGRFGVAQVHLWSKDISKPNGGEYVIHHAGENRRMDLHGLAPLILEYLENRERVLTLA